jgi:hypothetical protein
MGKSWNTDDKHGFSHGSTWINHLDSSGFQDFEAKYPHSWTKPGLMS